MKDMNEISFLVKTRTLCDNNLIHTIDYYIRIKLLSHSTFEPDIEKYNHIINDLRIKDCMNDYWCFEHLCKTIDDLYPSKYSKEAIATCVGYFALYANNNSVDKDPSLRHLAMELLHVFPHACSPNIK